MKIENIADLRVVIHAARLGSLSAASRALGITPAAASAALKRLEAQLGTRLFERSTRALRLTQSGQLMIDYATRAFDLLAEAESQMDSEHSALHGEIRVAAPSDLARTTLLPWIDEFLALHPEVSLSLLVGDQPLDVIRDEIDLAIRYGEPRDSRIVARKLLDTGPVLCGAPSYLQQRGIPVVPLDLSSHNCLVFQRGGKPYSNWRFGKGGSWTEIHVAGDRYCDDASLARAWAIAGAGLIYKTEIDVRSDLAAGALIRLLPDWETEAYPLYALLPSARFVPNRVRRFVDFIGRRFAAL